MTLPFTTKKLLTVSAGSDSAGSIPELNDDGVLDTTILNGTTKGGTDTYAGMTPILNDDGVLDTTILNGTTKGGTDTYAGMTPILNDDGVLDASLFAAAFSGGGSSKLLVIGGWQVVIGTATVPASNDTKFSLDITFPSGTKFVNCYGVWPVCGTHQASSVGTIPGLSVENVTPTGFTLYGDNDTSHVMVNNVPITYIAVGQYDDSDDDDSST